jgi:hypothetical protein
VPLGRLGVSRRGLVLRPTVLLRATGLYFKDLPFQSHPASTDFETRYAESLGDADLRRSEHAQTLKHASAPARGGDRRNPASYEFFFQAACRCHARSVVVRPDMMM